MTELLNKQFDAKAHLSKWKVGALFMEAGSGKTRVAIDLVNSVEDIDLVIYLTPLNTITSGNIQNEVAKWGGFNAKAVYYGIESVSLSERIYLEILSVIQSAKNPFVIVDESLKIKNAESKRTKRIIEIGKYAEYKIILNGTPLCRNILDLWSQMEFLSPKILKLQFLKYKNTFCEYKTVTETMGRMRRVKEFITGYHNIEYLYSLIRHYVFECDLNLQISQCYSDHSYKLSEDDMDTYQELKAKYLDDEMLEWKNNNIFIEMTQKMQHEYCLTPNKFAIVDEIFKKVNPEDTIIFCKFIKSRTECKKRYPKSLVLSYQKDSLGLNLQQYSNTIYFDKTWDYALRTQASRRTFRTGQENNCRYFDLTGNVGLEVLINQNIEKKISMVDYFKTASKKELETKL